MRRGLALTGGGTFFTLVAALFCPITVGEGSAAAGRFPSRFAATASEGAVALAVPSSPRLRAVSLPPSQPSPRPSSPSVCLDNSGAVFEVSKAVIVLEGVLVDISIDVPG